MTVNVNQMNVVVANASVAGVLLRVSYPNFYRQNPRQHTAEAASEVRSAIQDSERFFLQYGGV